MSCGELPNKSKIESPTFLWYFFYTGRLCLKLACLVSGYVVYSRGPLFSLKRPFQCVCH